MRCDGAIIKKWIKPAVFFALLLALACFLPSEPVGPWKIFNLRKIASIVFALAFVQVLGFVMSQLLGSRVGAVLAGFFGGLVSSTATTASLARKSKVSSQTDPSTETLTFLSATLAMLFEGSVIIFWGTKEIHASLFLIFLGPILVTAIMIFWLSRKSTKGHLKIEASPLDILPILRLSIFIIAILLLSKILQKVFGHSGLLIFTFLVSLFEIHGSVIANIQLHNAGAFNVQLLGCLLALSVAASYLSKLFLIFTLGSSALKWQAVKYTSILFLSLIASGLVFLFFV